MMVMTTIPMNVSMGYFFLGGIPDFDDLHVKVQGHACERVVSIHGYRIKTNLRYRYDASLVSRETHSRFYFLFTKSAAGNFLNEVFIFLTISFFGLDLKIQFFAFGFSFKTLFHSGNKIAGAMKVVQRITAFTRVDDGTFIITQCIMNGGYLVFRNLHKTTCYS